VSSLPPGYFSFHAEGSRRFPVRWGLFCETLVAKGADHQIGGLIVALPNGVDVVHALFIDSASIAALVSKKTRRARASYLTNLSAKLLTKTPRWRHVNGMEASVGCHE